MARQGITQFIDLGCGLPTTVSTRATVQQINPDARVLYVDHDPTAAAHAHALLTSAETTSAILVRALAPGSHLAPSNLTADQMPPAGIAAIVRAHHGATAEPRS
jgi:hypothetical protein